MKIDLEAIKNSKGYEFADNSHGELCRLVPIEEAQQQDKQLKVLEIIKKKGITTCSVAFGFDDYEEYSKSCFRLYNPLTEEEFIFLKEMLG